MKREENDNVVSAQETDIHLQNYEKFIDSQLFPYNYFILFLKNIFQKQHDTRRVNPLTSCFIGI